MSISLKLCILIPSFTFNKPIICRKMDAFALFYFFFLEQKWFPGPISNLQWIMKNTVIWIISLLAMNVSFTSTCGWRFANQRSNSQKIRVEFYLPYPIFICYNQERVLDYFVRALGTWILLWSLIRKLPSCPPDGNVPVGHCQQECLSGGMGGGGGDLVHTSLLLSPVSCCYNTVY